MIPNLKHPTSRSTILESINEAKPLPNLLRFHLLFHHYESNFPHRIVAFKPAFRSPKSRNARASHPSHFQCYPRTVEPPSPRVCHVRPRGSKYPYPVPRISETLRLPHPTRSSVIPRIEFIPHSRSHSTIKRGKRSLEANEMGERCKQPRRKRT